MLHTCFGKDTQLRKDLLLDTESYLDGVSASEPKKTTPKPATKKKVAKKASASKKITKKVAKKPVKKTAKKTTRRRS